MRTRTVLDGNAFYEIDEECMERKNREMYKEKTERTEKGKNHSEERKRNTDRSRGRG